MTDEMIAGHNARLMARRKAALRGQAEARAAQIARDVLDIKTLETRKSDRLDFHEVAVWELRKALIEAYLQGRRSARGGRR